MKTLRAKLLGEYLTSDNMRQFFPKYKDPFREFYGEKKVPLLFDMPEEEFRKRVKRALYDKYITLFRQGTFSKEKAYQDVVSEVHEVSSYKRRVLVASMNSVIKDAEAIGRAKLTPFRDVAGRVETLFASLYPLEMSFDGLHCIFTDLSFPKKELCINPRTIAKMTGIKYGLFSSDVTAQEFAQAARNSGLIEINSPNDWLIFQACRAYAFPPTFMFVNVLWELLPKKVFTKFQIVLLARCIQHYNDSYEMDKAKDIFKKAMLSTSATQVKRNLPELWNIQDVLRTYTPRYSCDKGLFKI